MSKSVDALGNPCPVNCKECEAIRAHRRTEIIVYPKKGEPSFGNQNPVWYCSNKQSPHYKHVLMPEHPACETMTQRKEE